MLGLLTMNNFFEILLNSKPNAKQFGELNMGNRDKPKREAKKPKKQRNPL